tara:strand:- start:619 stop:2778 length:2160 start_codon:yes stop_codon:yes gene_type:complete
MQRDFTFMELREDFLERDDVDIRRQSLKGALNMKVLQTGAAEARPGMHFVRKLQDADDIIEIRPATGLRFGVLINNNSLQIIDQTADIVFQLNIVPWSNAADVWVNRFRQKTIFGSASGGIHVLTYSNGIWTFAPFAFTDAAGGELAQPYWAFEDDITLQPSALNGVITITASKALWTSAYVGLRVRYNAREIEITQRISDKVARGIVINELSPSFRITVDDTTEYRIGDAVVAANTNYQGLIVAINGLTLDVVTQVFFEGPDVGEELSGPGGSSKVTAKAAIAPLASPVWDEPLMSDVRGWPRASGSAAGRMILLDFESVPDIVAVSSSRSIDDFKVGAADDDAIVRQVGDNAPHWLHAESVGDLILFSDSGIYNVPTRENGIISPATFNPVFIDDSSCSNIKPVKVEDGIIFVDSSNENVKIVMLDGNIYLKWSVKSLTSLHKHLIKTPRGLCGPSLGSAAAEKYVFVINGDGSVATVSWQESLRDENVGFAPWVTKGTFIKISPIFSSYWAIVDRVVNGTTVRFLERFDDNMTVDCGIESVELSVPSILTVEGVPLSVNGDQLTVQTPSMGHLSGETVAYYIDGWDAGDFTIAADGTIPDEPGVDGVRQVGLNFVASAEPWPVEVIESPRVGEVTVRVMEAIVSVQNTLGFEVMCNGVRNSVTAYSFGDDLSIPPAPKTKVRRFTIFGNRDHPEIIISKTRPGPFRILAIGQKVQA